MSESEQLGGISLSFPANEEDTVTTPSAKTLPRRLRRRLLEPKSPVSAEEIDSKLREADLRRQQYYESLSSKARPKTRSPRSARMEELNQRLEAKLIAAEQKRLSLLEKELARLAKLDEARQAAKIELEQRVEKERDELETKVEERVQKAEENRMLLFKAVAQRRAAKRQRAAHSLMQKAIQENRYKESVRAAIYEKRAAAEKKRIGLLEAEKRRTRTRLSRVFGVANSIQSQREIERRKKKDRLEERLQRAKKLRAQYMRRTRGMNSCTHPRSETMQENREQHVRILQRCWRRYAKYKKSTLALARAYHSLQIDEKSIESVPFEQLAIQINSIAVMRTVKELLDRLEIRLTVSLASTLDNIDHLLKNVAPPARRGNSPNSVSKGELTSLNSRDMGYPKPKRLVRYPARVFLCAYMIRQHPDAVFRERGEHEIALAESATYLIREFELLVKIILEGPKYTLQEPIGSAAVPPKDVRSQLKAFDKAWCSYLEGFVVWKTNDAKVLEEELSLTQESELPEVLNHTSLKLNEDAVNQKPAIFAETGVAGKSIAPEDSSSSLPGSSIFSPTLASGSEGISPPNTAAHSFDAALATENEVIVNEIVHDNSSTFADSFDTSSGETSNLQVRVKETMEKAFWDGVMESMKQSQPDFSWVLKLMKEVRDELCEISPKDLSEEIEQTIDTDVLSQLLASGNVDMDYFGNILEFSLGILLKLSAPANEEEIRTTHHNLMTELGEIVPNEGESNSSCAVLMVKGLRFVLQQIQILKKEISKARLKLLEPLLKGPAGLEYLKKAFSNRYGPPDQAPSSLPLTKQWLLNVRGEAEREWREHTDALSVVTNSHPGSSGLPPTTMRTGGNVPSVSKVLNPSSPFPGIELSECKGETVDLLVRLGLLKMVSEIGGLTLETVPETFQLNLSRLRATQSEIQKIILVSISVLILQQTLASENSTPIDIETTTSTCINRLYAMLDAKPDAGLSEILETLSDLPETTNQNSNDAETRQRVTGNMLVKSLQAGDAVFKRVSQTIYLALKTAVLAGNNMKRKQTVDTILRRIGAASLLDKVIVVSDIIILMANVSRNVHGFWYEELLK